MREQKIYGLLFLTFLKIGAFTFGGGYAMIPLIEEETVKRRKWIADEDILDIVAVAESTPGPIAINAATFVGYKVAGVMGALLATCGVVLPSFFIILAGLCGITEVCGFPGCAACVCGGSRRCAGTHHQGDDYHVSAMSEAGIFLCDWNRSIFERCVYGCKCFDSHNSGSASWCGIYDNVGEESKDMIYLQLFLTFLKIGAFTFGGGYAMLPLIQEEVERRGWISQEALIDFIAVSESTPGPFAVNISTYIGMEMGGIAGAVCATLGVILPSFFIILIVAKCFEKFKDSLVVKGCMTGLKPVVVGLIGAAIITTGKPYFSQMGQKPGHGVAESRSQPGLFFC